MKTTVAALVLLAAASAAAHRDDKKAPPQKSAGELAQPPTAAPAAQEAPAAAEAAPEAAEEVEVVEAAEPDSEVHTEPADEPAHGAKDLIGRFHPIIVHLPIGWLVGLLLLELVALRRPALAAVGLPLGVLALASFVPAVITGLLRLAHFEAEGADVAPALLHRNLMFATFGLSLAAVGLRYRLRQTFSGRTRYAYLVLLGAAVLLVSAGGHIGGELVYGEDYLPW